MMVLLMLDKSAVTVCPCLKSPLTLMPLVGKLLPGLALTRSGFVAESLLVRPMLRSLLSRLMLALAALRIRLGMVKPL